jgi:FkbH-like protein
MLESQNLIFEQNLSRIELLNYKPKSDNIKKISVYRNHSFELVENTIPLYLDYAGIKAIFSYSDYDDSMSFLDIDLTSDMLILWIDLTRYKEGSEDFIKERINYLSEIYSGQILFVPFGGNITLNLPNITVFDLSEIEKFLGEKYTDLRMETFSGTKLSSKALLMISKELGLKYIPACLLTPIKAVIVDLDNTLYKGVLGEDGYKNIELTEGHKKLQQKLAELESKGFFICVASKNEPEDVKELFKMRDDFPLKPDKITKFCVSWNPKPEAIRELKSFLNINEKDMLFIDDNIGEIVSVKEQFPDINIILAQDNAQKTLEILSNYPRMTKFNINYEDLIRKQDTQLNERRKMLQETLSGEEFLKTLEMKLTYYFNNKSQIKRFSELANKTNQFIFSYKRYSEKETENLMNDKNSLIITVSLKDKLSDSGIIGGLVFRNCFDYINIEEVFVSCRALGRGIDKNIVIYPIKLATEYFNNNKVCLNFTKGERNKPAENFINEYLKNLINKAGVFDNKINNDYLTVKIEG